MISTNIRVVLACLLFMLAFCLILLNLLGSYSLYAFTALMLAAIVLVFPEDKPRQPIVCKLAGLSWNQEEFNHNIFLSGGIGSGKTTAISNILKELFNRVPGWGGVWVEAKGDSHLHLLAAAQKAGRKDDVIILEVEYQGRRTYPIQYLNLLTAGQMAPQVISQILADLSARGESKSKSSDFFYQQVRMHIAEGIRFLTYKNYPVTAVNLYKFLCDRSFMLETIGGHEEKDPNDPQGRTMWVPDRTEMSLHWLGAFLGQVGEQRGGVVSSIHNALMAFLQPAVAEVFASNNPDTVDFRDITRGKIICVVCPSSYPAEKAALTQFFKSLTFFIASERYDLKRYGNADWNQLVLFADEYQRAAAPTDISFLDILRDANTAFVASCQDETSLVPVVGKDIANVILGKFRNKIIFSSESPESAEHSAAIFGKKRIWKKTFSSGKGASTSRSESDEFILRPEHFMRMPNWHCAILHTSKKFRKRVKLPLV